MMTCRKNNYGNVYDVRKKDYICKKIIENDNISWEQAIVSCEYSVFTKQN